MSETPTPRFPEAEPYLVDDECISRERMPTGDQYVADDPDNAKVAAYARAMFHRFERAFAGGEGGCWDLLRLVISGLGDKTHLPPPVRVDYGDNIAAGEGTFVNYGLVAFDAARISIGTYRQIDPNAQLLTPAHSLEPTSCACSLETADPITIGDNMRLGGGVIVCPGVTIGDDCAIGAGPIATKDIPASSLAAGSPAQVLCQLDGSTFGPRHQHPPQETP